MKLTFKILIMVGCFMLFSTISFGGEVYDVVTYWAYTEEKVTVEWDPVQDDPATPDITEPTADYYKIKLFHKEQQVEHARGRVDHPGAIATLSFPRSGHYIIMVTSCLNGATPEEDTCAEQCEGDVCEEWWTESIDPERSTVNGEPKGWWVYKHISPPSF
jgi:hypothetical protein